MNSLSLSSIETNEIIDQLQIVIDKAFECELDFDFLDKKSERILTFELEQEPNSAFRYLSLQPNVQIFTLDELTPIGVTESAVDHEEISDFIEGNANQIECADKRILPKIKILDMKEKYYKSSNELYLAAYQCLAVYSLIKPAFNL